MAFADFIRALVEQEDHSLYLTAQPTAFTSDQQPQLVTGPVAAMQDDFPLRPSLVPHLVPFNLNLWMGRR